MILEGIVTTVDRFGDVNVSPMGPEVDEERPTDFETLTLRPFKTSRTYANLRASGRGVFHITDDVLLLAQATIGQPQAPTKKCTAIDGIRLSDCCRFYEFEISGRDESGDRATLSARVVHRETVRAFAGFNRAQYAVVEAAILASRVFMLDRDDLIRQLDPLGTLVRKTGGKREHAAFELLRTYIINHESAPFAADAYGR